MASMICTAESCSSPIWKGRLQYCQRHYNAWRRTRADRPLCNVASCNRTQIARGWCDRHYDRWRLRGGDPTTSLPHRGWTLSTPERFWTKVTFTESCWIWKAQKSRTGYGRFYPGGGFRTPSVPAHRWAYEFCVGGIPAGLEIDHLCSTRACVHPDHLEPVTHLENLRRIKRQT